MVYTAHIHCFIGPYVRFGYVIHKCNCVQLSRGALIHLNFCSFPEISAYDSSAANQNHQQKFIYCRTVRYIRLANRPVLICEFKIKKK